MTYSYEGAKGNGATYLSMKNLKLNNNRAFTMCFFYKGNVSTINSGATIFALLGSDSFSITESGSDFKLSVYGQEETMSSFGSMFDA